MRHDRSVHYLPSRWQKGLVAWEEQGRKCLSVPFTWLINEARGYCLSQRERVVVGGPAVKLMPERFEGCADVDAIVPESPVIRRHNPQATTTSTGCDMGCEFCSVAQIEGPFRELSTWDPAPVVCDSNLLQCSDAHLRRVIDSLKSQPFVDLQGIEPRFLTKKRLGWLAELPIHRLGMGWDSADEERDVFAAIERICAAGFPKKVVYVYCLVNFRETLDDALYRVQEMKRVGYPQSAFVMRYQPPDTLQKNSYVAPQWDPDMLRKFCRYWNMQAYMQGIPWEEYLQGAPPSMQEAFVL